MAGCAKEAAEPRIAQLSVEGSGTYVVTFGTCHHVTVTSEDTWSTTLLVNPGDTVQLRVKTDSGPATLYMGVEMESGLLYCKSLYCEPESTGVLNHVVTP